MRERSEVETIIQSFYLVFQPIMEVLSETESDLYAYEVLLRSRETGRFPNDLFSEFIEEESSNQLLMNWYEQELKHYLPRYPDVHFDFNIHPQQLVHASTWQFLKNMQPFNKQLKVELTEHVPIFKHGHHSNDYNLNYSIKRIAGMGYDIAIDDIGSGQNTLDLVLENSDFISCCKFSLLPFRKLDLKMILNFLEAWFQVAQKQKFTFIVEGVDSSFVKNTLLENNIRLQQGFYWSKGDHL